MESLTWLKSSKCDNSGPNCVEIAYQTSTKSTIGNESIEVGFCHCDGFTAHVRDSKDPGGPVLKYNKGEWTAFLEGVKDGEFDI